MAIERTFSMIKPDATTRNLAGEINAFLESKGFTITESREHRMTRAEAEEFYGVHRERPFFGELIETITSGVVVMQILERDNAIAYYREVMGATNPAEAAEGTIRKMFALSIDKNSVHGSDSPETAATEIAFFRKIAG